MDDVDDVMVGPWGGNGGNKWLFRTYGGRIISYIITSKPQCVSSLEFKYTDKNGIINESGQFGTIGPNDIIAKHTFDDDEYITEIGGTVGLYIGMTVITYLYLKTNKNEKGYEFGTKNGTIFSLPLTKGKFDGFFGTSGDVIDSIGAILVP